MGDRVRPSDLTNNAAAKIDLRLAPRLFPSTAVIDKRLTRLDNPEVHFRKLVRYASLVGVSNARLCHFVFRENQRHKHSLSSSLTASLRRPDPVADRITKLERSRLMGPVRTKDIVPGLARRQEMVRGRGRG